MNRLTCAVTVLVVLMGRTLSAQSTTGALEIWVVDENRQPVAGAAVAVHGPGRALEQASDERGHVQFLALSVGSYTVQVRRIGFRPVDLRDVMVRLGQTTVQEAWLTGRAVELEAVIVEARLPLIDVTSTKVGATLPFADFAKLPLARDYHTIATLAPHNNVSYLGDEITVAGATGLENSYFIEGVNVSDVSGLRTHGTRLPYNFIRDVEIRTGGYQAEHRSSLGGVLNVVTSSGTNTLSGELFAFGTHGRLTAAPRQGVTEPTARGAYAMDFGASISGPVMRDRLWFFMAYNRATESDEILLPGLEFHRDHETVNRFAGKLTWQPGAPTTVVFTVFGDPSTRQAVGSTFGSYGSAAQFANPDPALGTLRRGGATVSLQTRHQISHQLLLEFSAYRHAVLDENLPATARGATEPFFLDNSTGTWSGGYPEQVRYRTTRASGSAAATIGLRAHTAKIGAAFVDNGLRQDATMLAVVLLNPDAPLYFRFLADAHGSVRNRVLSFYAQDDWRPLNRLTISLGARWDGQFLIDSRGSTVIKILDQYQPRAGVVFQPGRLGTQKLFGSFGRFYQDLHLAASALHHDYSNVFAFTFYDHDPRADSSGGVVNSPVFEATAPGLKGQYYDEWTLGYERQAGRSISVGVRLIARPLRDGVENSTDPATGTSVLGNPGRGRLSSCPRLRRAYNALELSLSGAPRANVSVLASYVLSRTHGNYGGLFNGDFGYVYANRNAWYDHCDEPAQFSNGDLFNDRRHALKIAGSWSPDPRLTLGAVSFWASGTPLSELGGSRHGFPYATFVRTRGSAGRTPSLLDVSLRVAYEPPLWRRSSVRPMILLDVMHIGNRRSPVNVDQWHYFGLDAQGNHSLPNPTYGQATRYAPPTSARLGMIVGL